MEDRELYMEEEEEAAATEEEGANRTFIILVAALGGLLALGICAVIVWAVLLGPRMRADREIQNQAILATNTAIAVALAETQTSEALPTPTETMAPTDTPPPTPTEAPTATPGLETPTAPGEIAEVTTTPPTTVPTRRPTATPRPTGEGQVPDTGIGMLGGGAMAVGLLFLLILVRRMRRTA